MKVHKPLGIVAVIESVHDLINNEWKKNVGLICSESTIFKSGLLSW